MTAITLPETRAIKVDKPRLMDWGGRLVPPLGGAVQTLNRLGTRWALDVSIPTMRTEPDGRTWAAALVQAKVNGVLMWFRQDGLDIGIPSTTSAYQAVDGAGQTGSTLNLKGFRPGYVMRLGQFFSVVTNARRYLHMATAITVADSAGKMALPIFPMLRASPNANDPVEVSKPMIQGSLTGSNEQAWTRLPGGFCDLGSITISEDE